MDAAGVGCRYFGLGDDRLYFHPPDALYIRLRIYIYIRMCVYARARRGIADVCVCPSSFTCRDDRLFESAGNSLTAVLHPASSSFFRENFYRKSANRATSVTHHQHNQRHRSGPRIENRATMTRGSATRILVYEQVCLPRIDEALTYRIA